MFTEENTTRRNIILLLKKSGGMSIDELSKVIDITPMGIRQHLLALEKKGIVSYIARKRGIGRPGFVYMLTEAADELFPKSYAEFALGVLRDVKKHDGPEKIDTVLGWRRDRQYKTWKDALAGKESIEDKLQTMKNILEAEGHMVDLSRVNGSYHFKQFNCPINKVASEFKEICRDELLMYRDLLGRNVTREKVVSEGDPVCLYVIPAV